MYAPALIGQGQPIGLPGLPTGLPIVTGVRRGSFRVPTSTLDDNIANEAVTSPENHTSSLAVDEERPMRRRGSQL